MKKIMLFVTLFVLFSFADEIKRTFLAPYTPNTSVSQTVSDFLNNPANRFEKIHVSVVYMDLVDDEQSKVILEAWPQKKLSNYWIDGVKVSEKDFFEYQKNHMKAFKSPGYDSVMSYDEIKRVIDSKVPVYIDVFKPREPANYPAYDSILQVSKITSNAFANLYNGSGIGIYFTETGCPSLTDINSSNYSQGYGDCSNGVQSHATLVTKVLQSTAPQAHIYGYDQHNYPNPDTVDPVINIGSHSWSQGDSQTYASEDAEMDNYIYNSGVTNFVCAGNKKNDNQTFNVTTPGKAVNAITVGAVNPRNNQYDAYSRWINSAIGNQKPELVNYAEFYFPNFGDFDGTSASTPYTAAMAADLMTQIPGLKRHPEAIKAYMLAQDGRTIYAGYNYDQDNGTPAALEVPYYNNQPDIEHVLVWNGNNACCYAGDGSIEVTETNIVSGHRYKIAIAWLVPGSYVLQNGYLSQDIDLDVYQGNTLVAYSISGINPFEMVDFTTQSSQDLRIVITRFSNSGYGKVALGYAMWHN